MTAKAKRWFFEEWAMVRRRLSLKYNPLHHRFSSYTGNPMSLKEAVLHLAWVWRWLKEHPELYQ